MKIKKPRKTAIARKLVKLRRMYSGVVMSDKDLMIRPNSFNNKTNKT